MSVTGRLFPESQWRAIAAVEHLTEGRAKHDGFQFWCLRKPLLGGSFAAGEFFLGQREDCEEFRVFERASTLEFSHDEDRIDALAAARARIESIGDYLPILIATWTLKSVDVVAEWEQNRTHRQLYRAAAAAKAAKPRNVSRRARAVFDAADGKCHYCATVLTLGGKWHIEHKFPRALFGGSEQSNLTASCVKCNHRKRDKTDIEFQSLLAAAATPILTTHAA